MSKINKVNFDGAYLRSSSGHFYTLYKYNSDLHSHWINWIGLLRKSLRLRPFRALKEIADKTLETFALHMTVRSAVRENVEQSIKGYLLTHCWTIAPPPILNERQWPHNNGTVKLFIPLHWVILVQLRGPKLPKKCSLQNITKLWSWFLLLR